MNSEGAVEAPSDPFPRSDCPGKTGARTAIASTARSSTSIPTRGGDGARRAIQVPRYFKNSTKAGTSGARAAMGGMAAVGRLGL
jgi:hypothetical protein